MKKFFFLPLLVFGLAVSCARADTASGLIKVDRQALAEAQATGDSSRIIAAKEQLSDDLSMQESVEREDLAGIDISLQSDNQGHFFADAVINNNAHASLIVDTGSPVVVLTYALAQQLGLDHNLSQPLTVEVLNGKFKAALVSLDSIKLGQAEAQNVKAIVLLQDAAGLKDGLLGMSFLSKFHFTLDQKGQKLILQKEASTF